MTVTLTDARRAMREALHRLVHEGDAWAEPSIAVFRNRLLDEVGSDARPLANLLIEAIDRGVVDALPRISLTPAQWSAKSTPLVMRWVNDRFVQAEVARWAVEAWGYALGCIDTSQLTASVDAPQPEPLTPQWPERRVESAPGAPSRAAARGGMAAPPSTGGAAPWRAGYTPTAAAPAPRYAARPVAPPPQYGRLAGASNSWAVANAPRVAIATAAIAVSSYIYIFVSAALREPAPAPPAVASSVVGAPSQATASAAESELDSLRRALGSWGADSTGGNGNEIPTTYSVAQPTRRAEDGERATVSAPTLASGIGVGGQATRVPLVAGSGSAPSLAMTRLPAEGATPSAYLELAARSTARGLTENGSRSTSPTAASTAPITPGVPGITRNALPVRGGDPDRVQRVRPATRPAPRLTGTLPQPTAPAGSRAPSSAVASGRMAAGGDRAAASTPPAPVARSVAPSASARVSQANAGAPATPGLDQLRLESGRRITGRVEIIKTSSVVFRDAETGLRYEFAKNDIDEIITEFGNAVRFRQAASTGNRAASDRRLVSAAGRYAVRYEAAQVTGSPACRDLWRGPSGGDAAQVRHRAGDDTLSIAFAGGDTFPSVMDADGFFSSTFRIMQGQEQLATALTTRLNGRFGADGDLTMQVTVIGYRRVQGSAGVSCQITVQASGEKRG